MTITLNIPITHRIYTQGQSALALEATDIGQAVSQLCERYPAMSAQILTPDGGLKDDIEISINGRLIPDGQRDKAFSLALSPGDDLLLSSIIAGG